LQQTVVVKGDPRNDWTVAHYQAGYDYAHKYSVIFGRINQALNNLDAIKKSLTAASAAAAANGSLKESIAGAQSRWQPVFDAFTANYKNDEDSIQRGGSLRESIPRTGFGGGPQWPPTAAQLDYAKRFDAAYADAMAGYNAYVSSLSPLQSALKSAGVKPLDGVKPLTP
jgi:hypothetical protein